MKQTLITLGLLLYLLSCSNNSNESEQLSSTDVFDLEYTQPSQLPIFTDYTEKGGMVYSDEPGKKRLLTHLQKDNLHIILLERLSDDVPAKRKLLDTVHFHARSTNQFPDLLGCENANKSDTISIFGAYEYVQDAEYFNTVLKAWTIDLEEDKIIEMDTTGIRCPNASYGE